MKMVNNMNVIRASGVLYNLHVKWQASDSEEEPAHAQVGSQVEQSGHLECSSGSSDSSDDEGAAGPRVANPDAAPHQGTCSTISQILQVCTCFAIINATMYVLINPNLSNLPGKHIISQVNNLVEHTTYSSGRTYPHPRASQGVGQTAPRHDHGFCLLIGRL